MCNRSFRVRTCPSSLVSNISTGAGSVGKQLVDLASDVEIEHIVIGHRSKNRLAAVREGHTGFVVAEGAAVPVTIVPEAVELGQHT
jgi:threonine dehydrogenase-like Zn-dependent dehydrogenase